MDFSAPSEIVATIGQGLPETTVHILHDNDSL